MSHLHPQVNAAACLFLLGVAIQSSFGEEAGETLQPVGCVPADPPPERLFELAFNPTHVRPPPTPVRRVVAEP